jgi:hypothetical protein
MAVFVEMGKTVTTEQAESTLARSLPSKRTWTKALSVSWLMASSMVLVGAVESRGDCGSLPVWSAKAILFRLCQHQNPGLGHIQSQRAMKMETPRLVASSLKLERELIILETKKQLL